MRHRSDTTTLRISDGTLDRSTMVIGMPSVGIRNSRDRIDTMLSRTAMPENMNEYRRSLVRAVNRDFRRRYGSASFGRFSMPLF